MTVRVLSIGLATPPGRLSQTRSAELGRTFAPETVPAGVIEAMHRRTRIDQRASVLVDPGTGRQAFYSPDDAAGVPTTAARMSVYEREAGALACGASASAIQKAGLDATRVTHIVTVSCTGFVAPGIDQMVVKGLGLRADVGRTHIGFMGCHGALNGTAVASAIAAADPAAVVLLCCVELCSLHMHYSARVDQLIANALFADGAAAAIFSQRARPECPEVKGCRSWLVPDSAELMAWHIGDRGFEMTLGATVPERLERVIPAWVESVLDSCNLRVSEVGGWAIHPGGPRIVEGLAAALGLPEAATKDSLDTLRENGNMSSPTVLFILDRMMRENRPRPWVAMAFGPGLAAEAVVLA